MSFAMAAPVSLWIRNDAVLAAIVFVDINDPVTPPTVPPVKAPITTESVAIEVLCSLNAANVPSANSACN